MPAAAHSGFHALLLMGKVCPITFKPSHFCKPRNFTNEKLTSTVLMDQLVMSPSSAHLSPTVAVSKAPSAGLKDSELAWSVVC